MIADKDGRDTARVAAMVQAISEALEDASGGREEFEVDRKTQKAVILDLIHLTESASKVSRAFQERHPKVPWALMSRLRNHGLVHDYGEVDLEEIWAFVRRQLPAMVRGLAGRGKRVREAPHRR